MHVDVDIPTTALVVAALAVGVLIVLFSGLAIVRLRRTWRATRAAGALLDTHLARLDRTSLATSQHIAAVAQQSERLASSTIELADSARELRDLTRAVPEQRRRMNRALSDLFEWTDKGTSR